MNDALAVLAHFALNYPRTTSVLAVLMVSLSIIGLLCAQVDTDKLRAAGWPRLATIVSLGAKVGALAIVLYASRKVAEKDNGSP